MVWSWSHTAEGIENVRDNIAALPPEKLVEVHAEWKAYDAAIRIHAEMMAAEGEEFDTENIVCPDNYFDEQTYNAFVKGIDPKTAALDILIQYIFERACDHATCDNGGFNAYITPYGTTVPFATQNNEEEE